MAHKLGSESTKRMQSVGIRAGRTVAPLGDLVPDGICHAVDDTGTLACGKQVKVEVFDQPWSRGIVDRCSECQRLVPLDET